jgi:hypothetical protein
MTPEEMNDIEARCNAATPGPWEPGQGWLLKDGRSAPVNWPSWGAVGGTVALTGLAAKQEHLGVTTHEAVHSPHVGANDSAADAAFIAAARTDVPALIAEVRRLREENATFRTLITRALNRPI